MAPCPAGHRLAADVVINFLQASILRASNKHVLRAAGTLAGIASIRQAQATTAGTEGSMSSGNSTGCILSAETLHFYNCNTSRALEKAAMAAGLLGQDGSAGYPLPPPLLLASADRASSVCKLDEELQELLVSSSGWQWVDEGRHGNHKWGFVANESGSWLELQLSTLLKIGSTSPGSSASSGIGSTSTTVATADSSQAALEAAGQLTIIFLQSYENMGTATVTCARGCTCAPATIDGHWQKETSQPGLQPLMNVTQNERCVLKVEVQPGTQSSGHKVKILGLVLASEAMSKGQLAKFTQIQGYESRNDRYGRRRELRHAL